MAAQSKKTPKAQSADVTVLIAGVASFVGVRLAEAVVDTGVRVIGIDSFKKTGDNYRDRLQDLESFELIEADLVDDLPESLADAQITHIIDATDIFPVVGNLEYSFDELLSSSYGLKHLLDLANNIKLNLSTHRQYIYIKASHHTKV